MLFERWSGSPSKFFKSFLTHVSRKEEIGKASAMKSAKGNFLLLFLSIRISLCSSTRVVCLPSKSASEIKRKKKNNYRKQKKSDMYPGSQL